jgi:hypothetical protein
MTGERRQRISELCVGADWALRRGDTASLADIAEELAARLQEPLHCRLVEVAGVCRADPAHAADAWLRIKEQVLLSV